MSNDYCLCCDLCYRHVEALPYSSEEHENRYRSFIEDHLRACDGNIYIILEDWGLPHIKKVICKECSQIFIVNGEKASEYFYPTKICKECKFKNNKKKEK